MSKEPEMTAAEQNLRACQKQLDMDGVMVGVSRQALEETLAELDASRAREAKLVEALRECVMCARHSWPPLVDFDALLAPYDTPAEMPSDCHPEGQ